MEPKRWLGRRRARAAPARDRLLQAASERHRSGAQAASRRAVSRRAAMLRAAKLQAEQLAMAGSRPAGVEALPKHRPNHRPDQVIRKVCVNLCQSRLKRCSYQTDVLTP